MRAAGGEVLGCRGRSVRMRVAGGEVLGCARQGEKC